LLYCLICVPGQDASKSFMLETFSPFGAAASLGWRFIAFVVFFAFEEFFLTGICTYLRWALEHNACHFNRQWKQATCRRRVGLADPEVKN
jgi:hypothetical protein